ncbi:hypothetical protein G7Y79_00073g098320 [Physcia stellaris]|nr:hypothetical protein G7Y79_00073g098320 [Physcia stellaris]
MQTRDLLVSCVDGQYQGYVSKSWSKIDHNETVSGRQAATSQSKKIMSLYDSQDAGARIAKNKITVHVCEVAVWHWAFNGNFYRRHSTLYLKIPAVENDIDTKVKGKITAQVDKTKDAIGKQKISKLNVFPIQYASAEIVDNCRRRGKTFWKCRSRCFVSYQATEKESIQNLADERYMVDLKTYYTLHPDSGSSRSSSEDELGPEVLARDVPPNEQFELLLPLEIKGYNLRIKKWFDLAADRISDVKWNKEAFKSLVIERKARDLIEALVSKQLAAEKGTDLIMGKGNGLILLLHGGPGTGKTLTAESVAEIAEKPLYRVTCGDVGTKAEDVEKYLESVLHLGKIWGCVVLLDEADVFLEQRSLEDMERNALVSVFLRVLEYYEGILVLTSNRVGTFDEAFKSRIQLALHYPVLGPYQRLRIWENFINRLESFAEDDKVDIADLRDHLEDLKEEKMNGRQIRNAITTARQYAEWKGTVLTYKYLSEVIEISGRFDKYLDRLNGDFTQDQLAEDEGLRLAG